MILFPHSITTLQVLSLYSQSVARLEQNLNLTERINELTEENALLLRQERINSDLPVSLEVTGRALAVSWCRLSSGPGPTPGWSWWRWSSSLAGGQPVRRG